MVSRDKEYGKYYEVVDRSTSGGDLIIVLRV